ncbi:threonine/serine exporter family protein [Flammeovirgaceae bacterium SG7u.111]|nr:threonine/serine exporter family protein [Flammeovirgaceae bacterium SG7u.132]WPO35887.1 threonine/serine exporter family protein [Flammeovirgaceae bacterium SG7u.111]
MELTDLLLSGVWGAIAAGGFAILFNVPVRTLLFAALGGAIGLICRNIFHYYIGFHLEFSSFLGALCAATWGAFWSHKVHTPGHVISIPSVIPMVPGVFSYKGMIGLINFNSSDLPQDEHLATTVSFLLKAIFILAGLSLGTAIPNLIDRLLMQKGKQERVTQSLQKKNAKRKIEFD